jgi:hypothetical protein
VFGRAGPQHHPAGLVAFAHSLFAGSQQERRGWQDEQHQHHPDALAAARDRTNDDREDDRDYHAQRDERVPRTFGFAQPTGGRRHGARVLMVGQRRHIHVGLGRRHRSGHAGRPPAVAAEACFFLRYC